MNELLQYRDIARARIVDVYVRLVLSGYEADAFGVVWVDIPLGGKVADPLGRVGEQCRLRVGGW